MDVADLLSKITEIWQRQIVLCKKKKHKDFGETAEIAWRFLGQKYDAIYAYSGESTEGQVPFPEAPKGYQRPTLNLSQNFVAVMLPYIHNKVPNRLVVPRRPQLSPELLAAIGPINEQAKIEESMRCWLLQWWLNYLPQETGLTDEVRKASTEALVKGRGVVWHELVETAAGDIPGSFYDTVDNLLIDADSQQPRDAGFIIRRRERSAWRLADEFGLNVKELRTNYRSNWMQGDTDGVSEPDNRHGGGDVCVYYEVFSRMGVGHKLVNCPQEIQDAYDMLDEAGPYVWLVIMPGVPYPLNLPPDKLPAFTKEEVRQRMSWPIPLYGDFANPWPCSFLDFYPSCENPWARSPLEAGLSMQVFMDYAYRFITSRVKATCRNIYVVSKEVDDAFKDQLEHGFDQAIAYINEKGIDLSKVLHVVEMPELNKDVWNVLSAVQREFEKATGMDPLMYGSAPPSQDRSAAATRTREAHLSSRPDDFADMTEKFNSSIANKEAVASRLLVGAKIISTLCGEPISKPDPAMMDPEMVAASPPEVYGPLTNAWMQLVYTPDDPGAASSDVQYTIEAGTGRKKNKQKQQEDANQLVQTLVTPLLQFGMQSGTFGPYNALMAVLGEAMEFPMERLMLPDMQPPPPPEVPGEPPPEEAPIPEESSVPASV